MRLEDVNRARELRDAILETKKNIAIWEDSTGFYRAVPQYIKGARGYSGPEIYLPLTGIDFNILKVLSLASLKSNLVQLELELGEL